MRGCRRGGRFCMLVLGISAPPAGAQWDPAIGQWGKVDPADVRIMTWNVDDGICSAAQKQEADNDTWSALAHIVAGLKPDVLVIQEAGDNEGYGAGGPMDSAADLTTTIDLFLHGGIDVFDPGAPPVTAWVQKYDPAYDLPYVFVSLRDDDYNRNALLSRFDFLDLNGDTKSRYRDIPAGLGARYAPGGAGGIRGFAIAELDLPDETYCGDLVVGTAHLKAGSDEEALAARLAAAQNIAYVLDYWYNGAGTGMPDPHARINDNPPATALLDEFTPVVFGADLNEDELYNGRRGPAAWLTQAQEEGGSDGVDRDRSDATYDAAVEPFTGLRRTYYSGSSKLDYCGWQDSIAELRHAFVFHSGSVPDPALQPAEVQSYAVPLSASADASTHRPVCVDLILPQVAGGCGDPCAGQVVGDANGDGLLDAFDIDVFMLALTAPQAYEGLYGAAALLCRCDINGDGSVNAFDVDPFVLLFTRG